MAKEKETQVQEQPAQEAEQPKKKRAPRKTKAKEAPVAEAPKQEAPVAEAPKQEAPAVEAPAAEAPAEKKERRDLNKGYVENVNFGEPVVSAHQNILDELGKDLGNAGRYLSTLTEPSEAVTKVYEETKGLGKNDRVQAIQAVTDKERQEAFSARIQSIREAKNQYNAETKTYSFDKEKVMAGDKGEQAKFVEHLFAICQRELTGKGMQYSSKDPFGPFRMMGTVLGEKSRMNPGELKKMISASFPEIVKRMPGMECGATRPMVERAVRTVDENYDKAHYKAKVASKEAKAEKAKAPKSNEGAEM